jgi:hypothetical protein
MLLGRGEKPPGFVARPLDPHDGNYRIPDNRRDVNGIDEAGTLRTHAPAELLIQRTFTAPNAPVRFGTAWISEMLGNPLCQEIILKFARELIALVRLHRMDWQSIDLLEPFPEIEAISTRLVPIWQREGELAAHIDR